MLTTVSLWQLYAIINSCKEGVKEQTEQDAAAHVFEMALKH